MRALVSCEYSGKVRDALIARGVDAVSCDTLPTERPGPHYQGDVRDILGEQWDLLIAHPPCTRLCNSGVRWLHERDLWGELDEAAEFFNLHLNATHIPRRAVENPIPHRYAVERIGRKPDQIIQPWEHGHEEMKATGLWLEGLPPLMPSRVVGPPPRDKTARQSWAKIHRASPGPARWKFRSTTYSGIAEAFAAQWCTQ